MPRPRGPAAHNPGEDPYGDWKPDIDPVLRPTPAPAAPPRRRGRRERRPVLVVGLALLIVGLFILSMAIAASS